MDYRRKVQEALKVRCIHLETKRTWLGLPEADEAENPIDTAVWTCRRTCEPLGPDASAADPETCEGPGRACYQPPVRP